ncbi:MAG: branched-chain amino acid ABC transporter permease [Deltaproteobacteria bacterium]|nr:branched-chain amino acid ABC transporter permease [Deltaproteobacteria bacterium]
MAELLQHLLNGLSLGAVYAVIALGYTMVYGILSLINFAHGDVFMLGAFAGYYVGRWTGGTEPNLVSAFLVTLTAMIACAGFGILVERFAYRPLRDRPRLTCLITAIGVSLLIENAAQLIFGAAPRFFQPVFPEETFEAGEVTVMSNQLLVIGVGVLLMVALQLIVFRTRMGKAMRAVSFNHEVAALMGIPVDRIIALTFGLGSALAAAAGILVAQTYKAVHPLLGMNYGLKAFVAAVLGGIGNIPGAVVGGAVLGFAEALVSGYGGSGYRDAIAFSVLILILIFKPSGLFGRFVPEKV